MYVLIYIDGMLLTGRNPSRAVPEVILECKCYSPGQKYMLS